MIYIYREAGSTGARLLAEALPNGARLRRTTGRRRLTGNDQIVCWGQHFPNAPGRALNNVPAMAKLTQATRLKGAGIPTITTSLTGTGPGEWLKRTNNHQGGNDLLRPPRTGDFLVKKEEIVKEFRVHSFLGRSIRSVVKVPREGYEVRPLDPTRVHANGAAHPWIRSWDGGWRMIYKEGEVKQKHRDLAHQAVKALGLDFGAVDIGQRADGSLLVLEVNTAPGIEGSTLEAYAKAVDDWSKGTTAPKEVAAYDVNVPKKKRAR